MHRIAALCCSYNATLCANEPSVFVSVASYRDEQCPFTVMDMFRRARCPNKVLCAACDAILLQ